MQNPPRIIFTVTNDLSYDQRMDRICTSLAENGFRVTLIGRRTKNSAPLTNRPYQLKRIFCFFSKGKSFYFEYNLKLFFALLFHKRDIICAIDLDTILPCYYSSWFRNSARVFDAHELFCEMQELVERPRVRRIWKNIEKFILPKFRRGYTVSESISKVYFKEYGLHYETIRNVPRLHSNQESQKEINGKRFLLYQGALNFGRGLPQLLSAMKTLDIPLYLCGEGNFSTQTRAIAKQLQVDSKIEFKGMILPFDLKTITNQAFIGINLGENTCLNNFYSLNNKFFDYMHSRLPQVAMNFPEFKKINDEFEIAILIDDLNPEEISSAVLRLIHDQQLYLRLQSNCERARLVYNWQAEEKKLLSFYKNLSK